MEFKKLTIKKESFEINLKFYFWLKHIVKTKLTDNQGNKLLESLLRGQSIESKIKALDDFSIGISSEIKKYNFDLLISNVVDELDIRVFIFSLKLYLIKDLLLAEAKVVGIKNAEELSKLHPLSVTYDNISLYKPYSVRVNGALLSLLFFENLETQNSDIISSNAEDFIKSLSKDAIELSKEGIEPNQIFMLMFSESVNQAITSDSGSNYEDRIFSVLTDIGIPPNDITKIHDEKDKSTEFDFFFSLKGKKFGLGAKRTLRERYKQFIKTSLTSDIDVMIEITLGLDLNEAKAKIIRSHGTVLFVADEIYKSRPFLMDMQGIYSTKDLTLSTLTQL